MSDNRRAISHLPSIECPYMPTEYAHQAKDAHAENLAYFAKEQAAHLAKAQRAMQVSTVRWRFESAQTLHLAAGNYSAFFGIRRKLPEFPVDAWQAAHDRATRIETPDPIRDAAKIRARERQAVRERATLQAQFDSYCKDVAIWNAAVLAERAKLPPHDPVAIWRETGKWESQRVEVSAPLPRFTTGAEIYEYRHRQKMRRKLESLFDLPMVEQTYDSRRPDSVFLRVNGDQIETSQGARVPLEHAPRLWRLVQACRATGRAYTANGHTEHAGPYAIDAVSAEGELRAGCHTIPYAELELLARSLGYVL
jgi:hypothetical protein